MQLVIHRITFWHNSKHSGRCESLGTVLMCMKYFDNNS